MRYIFIFFMYPFLFGNWLLGMNEKNVSAEKLRVSIDLSTLAVDDSGKTALPKDSSETKRGRVITPRSRAISSRSLATSQNHSAGEPLVESFEPISDQEPDVTGSEKASSKKADIRESGKKEKKQKSPKNSSNGSKILARSKRKDDSALVNLAKSLLLEGFAQNIRDLCVGFEDTALKKLGNTVINEQGDFVLLVLAREGNFDAVDFLLQKGSDPFKANNQGMTLMHIFAAMVHNEQALSLLVTVLSRNDCKLMPDKNQYSPIDVAVFSRNLSALELFWKFLSSRLENECEDVGESTLHAYAALSKRSLSQYYVSQLESIRSVRAERLLQIDQMTGFNAITIQVSWHEIAELDQRILFLEQQLGAMTS